MNHLFARFAALAFVVLFAAYPFQPAAAQGATGGALSFEITAKTVTAGKAASSMKPIWDIQAKPMGTPRSTTPDVAREYTVTTKRTAGGIEFTLVLPDETQANTTGGSSGTCNGAPSSALCKGDTIRVFIDPNNSKNSTLQLASALNTTSPPPPTTGNAAAYLATDHLFEIDLGNRRIGGTLSNPNVVHKIPVSLAGGTTAWGRQVGAIGNCTGGALAPSPAGGGGANCTWNRNGQRYAVTLSITWAELGLTTAQDFGLAIAVINDLGLNDASGSAQLTTSSFPLSLPINNSNNVVETSTVSAVPASGVWAQPNQWGLGFVNPPISTIADLSFDQSPIGWHASAIRLSKCGVTNWASSAASAASGNGVWKVETAGSDQTTIPGWYKYYPAGRCQMGLWINVHNSGTAVVRAKLLVLWGRPHGAVTGDMTRVTLTQAIDFQPGDNIGREIWGNVPGDPTGSGMHPCIRVYILPETFNSTQTVWVDSTGDLSKLERDYGVAGTQVAQMNLTNMAGAMASCPAGEQCTFPVSMQREVSPLRKVVFERGAVLAPSAYDERRKIPDTDDPGKGDPRPDPMVRVDVTSFGVELPRSGQDYVFIEVLGGLGWMAPSSVFGAPGVPQTTLKSFAFDVGNPAFSHVDRSTSPPTLVPSPTRRIFLSTRVASDNGVSATATVQPLKDQFAPGEVVVAKADVAVTPTQPTQPGPSGFWRWLLLLIALVLVI